MAVNISKDVVHDIALFMKNRMDLESFLSWFETRMASSLTETNPRCKMVITSTF